MTFTRTLGFLLRTPLVRQPSAGPVTVELTSISSSPTGSAGRPRAYSRTISGTAAYPSYAGPASAYGSGRVGATRGYASDKGKQELYSDEAGSTGAGTDDVAHTGAAYDSNTNPHSAAKGVEQEVRRYCCCGFSTC
jgi:hypothetical protein